MKTMLAFTALLAAGAINLAVVHGADARAKFPPAPKCKQCSVINVKGAVAAAKRAIVHSLRDPDSVRWRGAAKVDTVNGNVCIEVNARNGFGGYTGFTLVTYNARFGTVMEGGWCVIRGNRAAVVNAN